ncbi:U-box-domain-containing protein [Annulohypoxylon truncatum]|uniref:U-box-domain-containing protein n=1 Tax=Annulohypoxylon truncatum TaxID=327061 RepID=UPI002007E652|nr:U-box-domain-containing protein [Annulohypoxylon truncatum]KAI1208362.1 U-box-domain-containing protein [Annulohypoxylon truncatum]
MAKDVEKSAKLKEDGNHHYQAGDFPGAEALYSKAIIADETNPSLYTNRAMARIQLGYYDSAISDCNECLKLSKGENLKAHFILSKCQLAIKDCDAALESALQAHRLCVKTNDKSLGPVTDQVLRCKKDRWDEMEKRRIREGQELEGEIIALMEREREDMVNSCTTELDRKQVGEEWDHKIATLRETFEKSRSASEQKREVPDWAIDEISFAIMVDPVMTKTGKSYDRSSIMEHLRRHPIDPLTREPLHPSELRPNIQLREACQEFLDKNGWAADW